MTIDKAIESLESLYKTECCKEEPDYDEAVRLGIEALKETKRLRSYKAFHVVRLLPGETEK